MIFSNVVRRFIDPSRRRGITAPVPGSAASNRRWRIGRSSGAIGTTRTACPSCPDVFALRTTSRPCSQSTSPQRSATSSEGQRSPAYRLSAITPRQRSSEHAASSAGIHDAGMYRARSGFACEPVRRSANGLDAMSPQRSARRKIALAMMVRFATVAAARRFSRVTPFSSVTV
ncbi:MAG: hypothetical protein SFY69_13415 [Planctomycetota bacterium]|nr:hypothetical protein [Planctomycetota bacterium]